METEAPGLQRPGSRRRAHHVDAPRRVFLIGTRANETNERLADAWAELGVDAVLVPAADARELMRASDLAVGRLDVTATLDGVEPGLLELLLLERAGLQVVNTARALLNCHDKWRTARGLEAAELPHPRTAVVRQGAEFSLQPPLVVKPRFGSWGADVERCQTRAELEGCLARAAPKPWFRRHGALVQELVPATGADLRIVVAGGTVVGAIERRARPGEWRTNTSLGGVRTPVDPPDEACALALSAARAVGADFVGVDLLPLAGGGYTVIELNGAVDFTPEYALLGRDPFEATAVALGLCTAGTSTRTRCRASA